MNPASRLFFFALLTVLVTAFALWLSRESVRPHQSPREAGLRWLREEYHLDDATFAKIEALHKNYFSQFRRMCQDLDEADRPLLSTKRLASRSETSDSQVRHAREICDKCEEAATTHLRQVAELMPPAEGKRFLEEMLPAVKLQHAVHDRNVSSGVRQ